MLGIMPPWQIGISVPLPPSPPSIANIEKSYCRTVGGLSHNSSFPSQIIEWCWARWEKVWVKLRNRCDVTTALWSKFPGLRFVLGELSGGRWGGLWWNLIIQMDILGWDGAQRTYSNHWWRMVSSIFPSQFTWWPSWVLVPQSLAQSDAYDQCERDLYF